MPKKNDLIIAAAGSGKTTLLVKKALAVRGEKVLITTFTTANEQEIRNKFIEINKSIPENVVIQTWFSFLLQHGVRPFQGAFLAERVEGLILVNEQSGLWFTGADKRPVYYPEINHFQKHYFNRSRKIYSDKLAKFVIRCNEKTNGHVLERLSKIYSHIFIDEVQDLAGYDLEILILLFKSTISILLVGDPRQVTYLTHHDKKHSGYKGGMIVEFIHEKCKKIDCNIDETSLKNSHRNNKEICLFASKLYPNYAASIACECDGCRSHQSAHNGVFLLRPCDVQQYIAVYNPTILRYQQAVFPEWNFGKAKGLGFDRVLIYPTNAIGQYLKDGKLKKVVKGKSEYCFDIAKFYVALTRAKHSAAIVFNYKDDDNFIGGIEKFDALS